MTDQIIIEAPKSDPLPLIFDSPHSGARYPDDFDHVLDRALLRRSEDAFIDELYDHVPDQGATLLHALFPRCYIDPNRGLLDIDPAMIDGGWPGESTPSFKLDNGVGLIWRQVKTYGRIYDRLLSQQEVQSRIDCCWQPYHSALSGLFEHFHAKHGFIYHVDCHSMPEWGDETTEDGVTRRADFVLGDRDGTTCEKGFSELIAKTLRDEGYSVLFNEPYKGVELVQRYSDPAANRYSIQIEINRVLYMDEDKITRNERFDALKQSLRKMTQVIADYVSERVV
ncbi:N-formylglutamate amidohydrolase [Pelagibius sp. Alg239-R121]|uniref:N-formylglutamate amidohydrolase n=1 Tax=Pelagibius sp. Alg239-R121 TaxID=2993448 RepID=UPI0024A69167|nr:N-formylglutamate amidohydrolase [Pelagibius sp. Alg239-R121]